MGDDYAIAATRILQNAIRLLTAAQSMSTRVRYLAKRKLGFVLQLSNPLLDPNSLVGDKLQSAAIFIVLRPNNLVTVQE
jgi:hypothetical protein